jgi:hypothetical protein
MLRLTLQYRANKKKEECITAFVCVCQHSLKNRINAHALGLIDCAYCAMALGSASLFIAGESIMRRCRRAQALPPQARPNGGPTTHVRTFGTAGAETLQQWQNKRKKTTTKLLLFTKWVMRIVTICKCENATQNVQQKGKCSVELPVVFCNVLQSVHKYLMVISVGAKS